MPSEKTLATHTRKELAQMARYNKVEGWHSMKKAELIQALKNRPLVTISSKKKITERTMALRAEEAESKHAPLRRKPDPQTAKGLDGKPSGYHPIRLNPSPGYRGPDCLEVSPQGSHWIYTTWQLTPGILERAEACMGSNWHQAAPVLRVYDFHLDDDTSPTKQCIAKIPLFAGAEFWHVPIADPSRTYELQLGYETAKGQFFLLARSKALKLPQPGSPEARKHEEQRQEANGQASEATSGHRFPIRGSSAYRFSDDVSLQVTADLLVVGQTSPHAVLNCQNQRIAVQPNGTFEIRLNLEDGRQVIPLEAVSPDGCQSRTVVLAIERNTKTLEPLALNEWDE